MCFKKFFAGWRKITPIERVGGNNTRLELTLPHPEEPVNPLQTVANTPVSVVMAQWFTDWNVPEDSRVYFTSVVDIQLFDEWTPEILQKFRIGIDTPAFTFGDEQGRHFYSLVKWFNAGVIAHEQAHNSYNLMNNNQKADFIIKYDSLKDTDSYIKLLYSINQYGLQSPVEGHAEIYRYIGNQMPDELKLYYPKLFKNE